jgi:hypothetical protein
VIAVLASLITGCEGDGPARPEAAGSDRTPGVAPSPGRDGEAGDGGDGGEQGRTGAPGGGSAGQALPRCHTDQLRGRLTALDPGAGNRYAALVLTNESDRPCRTYGWVGLQLAAPGDRPLPTRVERTGSADRVVLKPGASAWSRLRWGVVPAGGEPADRPCRPTPSAVRVIPPDERTQVTAEWRYGPVCDGGRIIATPMAPGSGPTG